MAPLRPEVRATGHRPPDTLLVDFVRDLAEAEFSQREIADFIVEDAKLEAGARETTKTRAPKRDDYWFDRVGRALQKTVGAARETVQKKK